MSPGKIAAQYGKVSFTKLFDSYMFEDVGMNTHIVLALA